MLAVPRDTLVDIPGVGEDKINAAFASGGPELTVETLENLTGVRMNDYVIVHFGGVEEIVDALGGITLEVDKPIRVGIDGRRVYIPAGTQTLDGTQALAYVRYRGGPTADIGRIGRQQKFLRELARQSTSPAKLPRLPATARATWRNIDTNMSLLEAARFASPHPPLRHRGRRALPGHPTVHRRNLLLGPGQRGRGSGRVGDDRITAFSSSGMTASAFSMSAFMALVRRPCSRHSFAL